MLSGVQVMLMGITDDVFRSCHKCRLISHTHIYIYIYIHKYILFSIKLLIYFVNDNSENIQKYDKKNILLNVGFQRSEVHVFLKCAAFLRSRRSQQRFSSLFTSLHEVL